MTIGSSVLDLPRVCINLFEAAVSTAASIAQTVIDTASTVLLRWWSGDKEDDSSTLETVERQTKDVQDLDDIVEENNRLKRMLEFAMTSHVIMNEATSMLEDNADFWMKRAEDIVVAKVQEAEAERNALALQFEGLQEQLGEKEQEIERLRDGFVWSTESLNAKEDEICELHEQLERYEALLKVLQAKVL
ncbi:hypothetical protein PRNP1_008626 [Phytophthora ramorum]|uniref:uncharacterized protein n=1 Tax=Phytophthora ramorum TaxID=164328 RepID=UPI00309755F8|nr:hypothetical protein KRP23_6373 [Phytophthora ramorum]